MEPVTFSINSAADERGKVTFVNDFDMTDVKRSYVVKNTLLKTVRAWHGHRNEKKMGNRTKR